MIKKEIIANIIATHADGSRMGIAEPYAIAFGDDDVVYSLIYTNEGWNIICDGIDELDINKIQDFLEDKVFKKSGWGLNADPIQSALKRLHQVENDTPLKFDESLINFGEMMYLGAGNSLWYVGKHIITIEVDD